MTLWYVDTSALAKLLRPERESAALREALERPATPTLVASELLVTELSRVALSQGPGASDVAEEMLRHVQLRRLTRSVLARAGQLQPPTLRSLDAIHLATMVELADDLDRVICYDNRLADAASHAGLRVVAPGA